MGRHWTYSEEKLRADVLRAANYQCQIRGPGCLGTANEVDHIHPKAWGGLATRDNLRAACRPCNRAKGFKTDEQLNRSKPLAREVKARQLGSFNRGPRIPQVKRVETTESVRFFKEQGLRRGRLPNLPLLNHGISGLTAQNPRNPQENGPKPTESAKPLKSDPFKPGHRIRGWAPKVRDYSAKTRKEPE